jgi:hypothetical protein
MNTGRPQTGRLPENGDAIFADVARQLSRYRKEN